VSVLGVGGVGARASVGRVHGDDKSWFCYL
jgi:hypothetical protein